MAGVSLTTALALEALTHGFRDFAVGRARRGRKPGGDAFLMVPTKRNFFELPGPREDIDWERHVRPMIRDLMTLLAVAQLVCRINVPQPVGEPPANPMA